MSHISDDPESLTTRPPGNPEHVIMKMDYFFLNHFGKEVSGVGGQVLLICSRPLALRCAHMIYFVNEMLGVIILVTSGWEHLIATVTSLPLLSSASRLQKHGFL